MTTSGSGVAARLLFNITPWLRVGCLATRTALTTAFSIQV